MINKHLADDVTESRKSPHFWQVQVASWSLYALLGVVAGWILITLKILPSSLALPFFELIFLRSAFGFLVTSSFRPLLIKVHARRLHPVMLLLILFPSPFLLASADLLLVTRVEILNVHFHALSTLQLMGVHLMAWGFFIDIFIFTVWYSFYFAASLFLDSMELSRRQQKSELSLLRYQMHPHFLFNALTAVMSVSDDKGKVEELTQSLADYLRFSLSKRNDNYSPLGDELEALENYLHVERIRFSEKLQCRIDTDLEARAWMVPSQLVQPLLENAIKYGQQTSPMPLSIHIQAQIKGDHLHLTVENTGSWVEPSASSRDQGMGMGVSNLRRRLQLIYGDRTSLTYEHSPQRVRAMITLPLMKP